VKLRITGSRCSVNEQRRQVAKRAFLDESAPAATSERGVILKELQGRFDRRLVPGPHRLGHFVVGQCHWIDTDFGGENDSAKPATVLLPWS
jgi:hypothetical protein